MSLTNSAPATTLPSLYVSARTDDDDPNNQSEANWLSMMDRFLGHILAFWPFAMIAAHFSVLPSPQFQGIQEITEPRVETILQLPNMAIIDAQPRTEEEVRNHNNGPDFEVPPAPDGETENVCHENQIEFSKTAIRMSAILLSIAAGGVYALTQVNSSAKNPSIGSTVQFFYVACNISFTAAVLVAIVGLLLLVILPHNSPNKTSSVIVVSAASFVFVFFGCAFLVAFNTLRC